MITEAATLLRHVVQGCSAGTAAVHDHGIGSWLARLCRNYRSRCSDECKAEGSCGIAAGLVVVGRCLSVGREIVAQCSYSEITMVVWKISVCVEDTMCNIS